MQGQRAAHPAQPLPRPTAAHVWRGVLVRGVIRAFGKAWVQPEGQAGRVPPEHCVGVNGGKAAALSGDLWEGAGLVGQEGLVGSLCSSVFPAVSSASWHSRPSLSQVRAPESPPLTIVQPPPTPEHEGQSCFSWGWWLYSLALAWAEALAAVPW